MFATTKAKYANSTQTVRPIPLIQIHVVRANSVFLILLYPILLVFVVPMQPYVANLNLVLVSRILIVALAFAQLTLVSALGRETLVLLTKTVVLGYVLLDSVLDQKSCIQPKKRKPGNHSN